MALQRPYRERTKHNRVHIGNGQIRPGKLDLLFCISHLLNLCVVIIYYPLLANAIDLVNLQCLGH